MTFNNEDKEMAACIIRHIEEVKLYVFAHSFNLLFFFPLAYAAIPFGGIAQRSLLDFLDFVRHGLGDALHPEVLRDVVLNLSAARRLPARQHGDAVRTRHQQ